MTSKESIFDPASEEAREIGLEERQELNKKAVEIGEWLNGWYDRKASDDAWKEHVREGHNLLGINQAQWIRDLVRADSNSVGRDPGKYVALLEKMVHKDIIDAPDNLNFELEI